MWNGSQHYIFDKNYSIFNISSKSNIFHLKDLTRFTFYFKLINKRKKNNGSIYLT